ncbi:MAG: hypothetical protein VXZ82_02170 [Planctomycetota bacterium]|nr:hypothetical protein [Planctomycetota bacterium]
MNLKTAETNNPSAAPFATSSEMREELRQFLSQAQERLESIETHLTAEKQCDASEQSEAAAKVNNNESRLEDSLLGALPQAVGSFPGSESRIDNLIETLEPQATRPQQQVQIASPQSSGEVDDKQQDRLQAIKMRLQQQLRNN